LPVRIGRSADAVRGAIWGRFGGPGGDLLFHALRRSTIGAEGFHGRVRDGIGCLAPRYGHQAGQNAPARKRAAGLGAPAGLRAAGANGAPAPCCAGDGPAEASCVLCVLSRKGFAARPSGTRFLVPGFGRNGRCACRLGGTGVPPGCCLPLDVDAQKRYRAISTGQLRGLPRFHLRPIDVVVYHGSRRDLVLRRVSRLDAFSGYPVRT
jgi:hypothetical protein